MKFNISFALALLLCTSVASISAVNTTSNDLMVQGTGNGSTIFFVKSMQDLDAIIQSHEAVLVCVFNPLLTSTEMIQLILREITQTVDIPVACVCINAYDIPTIKDIFPFSAPATLISFIQGELVQQIDIDLKSSN